MGRYLHDPTFSRFDTILELTDRQTHRHTHTDTRRRHIPRLAQRRAVKNKPKAKLTNTVVRTVDICGCITVLNNCRTQHNTEQFLRSFLLTQTSDEHHLLSLGGEEQAAAV